jgi:hypothetical protein
LIVRAFMVAFVWLCATTSVWAQASTGPRPAATPPERATGQKKPLTTPKITESGSCGLGVIASVGDEFQVEKIELLRLGSAATEVPISNWGLDDLAFERVRAAAGPGTIVRRIPDKKDPPPTGPKPLFRDLRAELVEGMRRITNGTSCQRYVLVSKSISRFNDSSQTVRGIGIVDWDNPFHHRTYLFALGYIRVFDGRDFSIIRQGSAMIEHEPLLNRMLLGTVILGPYRELDNGAFPSNPTQAADNRGFRDGVRAMLRASLDRTLPVMLRPQTTEISR